MQKSDRKTWQGARVNARVGDLTVILLPVEFGGGGAESCFTMKPHSMRKIAFIDASYADMRSGETVRLADGSLRYSHCRTL